MFGTKRIQAESLTGKLKGIAAAFIIMGALFLWAGANTVQVSGADELENPAINSAGTASAWDCVYFGSYPQSSDGSGGYLTEPIKWRVIKISEASMTLLADKKLDVVPFHSALCGISFQDSDLKQWLNTEFMNTAFTEDEQSAILDTFYGKVHLISKSEVSNAAYGFISNHSRSAFNTNYTTAQFMKGASNEGELAAMGNVPLTYGAYWLRDAASSQGESWVVRGTGVGEVQCYGWVNSKITGVRPMIQINPDSAVWSYAGRVNNLGNEVKAGQTITGNDSFTKVYGNAPFALGAKAKGNLTYRSDNPGVASVSAGGMVTVKSGGTANITIQAAETLKYQAAEKTVKITVRKADQAISAQNMVKTYGAKAFSLKASAKTKLTYKSGSSKIASISPQGMVSLKNPGKTTITLTASETPQYKKAVRTIRLQVKLKKPKLKVRSVDKRKIRLTWSKVPGADKYQVYCYDRKKKRYVRKITKSAKKRFAIHGNVKRKKVYKYKVRAYRVVDGKKVYSEYSSVKRGRAK